jgi:hypothetical protein
MQAGRKTRRLDRDAFRLRVYRSRLACPPAGSVVQRFVSIQHTPVRYGIDGSVTKLEIDDEFDECHFVQ